MSGAGAAKGAEVEEAMVNAVSDLLEQSQGLSGFLVVVVQPDGNFESSYEYNAGTGPAMFTAVSCIQHAMLCRSMDGDG